MAIRIWMVKLWIMTSAAWCIIARVQSHAQDAERRPVSRADREHGGAYPGRGELDVRVQGREQRASRPGDYPAHR